MWKQAVKGLQVDPKSHLRLRRACILQSHLSRRGSGPALAQGDEQVCSLGAGGGMSTEDAGLARKEGPADCVLQQPVGDVGIYCRKNVV